MLVKASIFLPVVFVISHKSCKSLNAKSSRQKQTAMREVVSMQNAKTICNIDGFINNVLEKRFRNRNAEDVQNADFYVLVYYRANFAQLALTPKMCKVEVGWNVPLETHKKGWTAKKAIRNDLK